METKRQKLESLRAQLESERSSFVTSWRELGEYILPRRPRFFTSDANKGDRRNQKIIDSTATLAARTLRSGMMSGVTSPARPWFRLTTQQSQLAEYQSVKEWLSLVGQRMTDIFLRSNLYNVLPVIYGDMGTFGSAAMMVEEDFDEVMRFYPFPIGSYSFANNDKLQVRVFSRDFRMTVRQLVNKFGKKDSNGKVDFSNFSDSVKTAYERGQFETWIDVCHLIYPNEDYDKDKLNSKFKKFASVYFEKGQGTAGNLGVGKEGKLLSEKGYDYFPVLCPRWEVNGEDVYGTECPGMTSIGDIKALQLMHKRMAQAIEKKVNPPMTAPASLKNQKASILPGDITYQDVREGQLGFRPVHEVNISLVELQGSIAEHQNRIRRAFFEDLFMMLAMSDRRQITAREIEERHEEKLLALGPVLEQLNQDLLDPLIDIAFSIMLNQGLIPEAPEELHGQPLKVEYISIMAQAQKLVGINSIERFAGFVGNVAQADPGILDKIDTDQMIDVYGEHISINPTIIRSDEAVAEIRAQKAQAQKQANQMAALQQGAQTANVLSQTDISGDSALKAIMEGSV